jgi:hypothetical protein
MEETYYGTWWKSLVGKGKTLKTWEHVFNVFASMPLLYTLVNLSFAQAPFSSTSMSSLSTNYHPPFSPSWHSYCLSASLLAPPIVTWCPHNPLVLSNLTSILLTFTTIVFVDTNQQPSSCRLSYRCRPFHPYRFYHNVNFLLDSSIWIETRPNKDAPNPI